jgi:hypothetical protein
MPVYYGTGEIRYSDGVSRLINTLKKKSRVKKSIKGKKRKKK